ncbi:RibD domain-containing protein [Microbacterium telephonicum]|uniref:RibD domain-containing protein n=1 Tax=Microbacterium telephonicum TaxID=1714841 RepID=A0A498BRA2_9MICO|nr:RibD domain-containing protein [Microbacterium telephonicum]
MTRGRIVIDLFTTLDGVAQAPGGPDEDTSGGFPWGGWQAPIDDDLVGERVGSGIRRMDALLLGRRTYDIFAAYWPQRTGGDEGGRVRVRRDAAARGRGGSFRRS